MSTKTNFKRIALVAVTALGMGVLSSAPSQAIVPASSLTLTASSTAGSIATVTGASDSTTAATITLTYLGVTATTDSVSLTVSPKSKPAAAAAYPQGLFLVTDTTSSTTVPTVQLVQNGTLAAALTNVTGTDSGTAVSVGLGSQGSRYVTVTAKVFMDTATTRAAGAYVYTVIAT